MFPSIGRFTQADPSWQESNRYLYAGANPINYTNPTGQFLEDRNYGCAPYSTPYCGYTPWAFAAVFVAALTC